MRILGFSKKDWVNYLTGNLKLEEDIFTTFRFQRHDRDWEVGEVVQVVSKPRTKGRELLGIAMIVGKAPRWVSLGWVEVSELEAKADGFSGISAMIDTMAKMHHNRNYSEPMNKLTVQWAERKRYAKVKESAETSEGRS